MLDDAVALRAAGCQQLALLVQLVTHPLDHPSPLPSSLAVVSRASIAASRVNSSAYWTSSATEVLTGSRANRTTDGSNSTGNRLNTLPAQVISTLRSRPGNGAPESSVCGTARTAARENGAAEPGHRAPCALSRRNTAQTLGRTAIEEPDEVGRGEEPHPSHADHDGSDDEDVDERTQRGGAVQTAPRPGRTIPISMAASRGLPSNSLGRWQRLAHAEHLVGGASSPAATNADARSIYGTPPARAECGMRVRSAFSRTCSSGRRRSTLRVAFVSGRTTGNR